MPSDSLLCWTSLVLAFVVVCLFAGARQLVRWLWSVLDTYAAHRRHQR